MPKSSVLKDDETPHDYRIKLENEELKLIKKFNIKNVLEVCSGDGRNIVYFSKQGYHAIGIESEDKFIKKSKELIKKESVSANIIKHQIFMKNFPFDNEKFEFVYSYQYLNHNFKDQIEDVFKEIYRVLKKGGLFSIKITDIEQFNLKHIKGAIYQEGDPEFPQINYRKLAEQTFAKLEDDEIWIPHYGFYKSELVDSLKKAGFKLINIRKIRWNIVGNFTK
jgi:ubiquinone/menaquinone biosynthesis C-methylase UbiE